MKRVVSVSLGSSKRDKKSQVEILGEEFEISRVGTDGDMKRFGELIAELDGKVDAIGLGGIDRYLWVDDRRYTVRDADRLARIAKLTPVVDGSGVKNTLERRTIEYLQDNGLVDFADKNVLVVCAVDRFGMAQTIAKLAKSVFDERNPAVKMALAHLIKTAHENGVKIGICGQAPSDYPEIVEFLVERGIDSISLNPDVIGRMKQVVAKVEQNRSPSACQMTPTLNIQ